jgi:hypothetical protein
MSTAVESCLMIKKKMDWIVLALHGMRCIMYFMGRYLIRLRVFFELMW